MMLANTPAVFLGERMTQIAPLRYVRIAAALVFLALGIWALAEALD
jgi:putative Ca2+/H+ antiporter (TMEM165/GDT1 family)